MFDNRCRPGVEKGLKPVGSTLQKVVTANQLTVIGLVLSAVAAVFIAQGWLIWGFIGLTAAAIPDVLDGAVAKASGTASPRGAFFDSVVDRVSDSLLLGGVAWHLTSVDGGHAAMLPLAVLAASGLVSYERARAESLGFSARGGLMERAERIVAIGLGLLFSAILVPILWVMLALTLVTAGHRFVMVWRQASAPTRPPRASRGEGAGRWRGWRPGTAVSSDEADRLVARWRTSRNERLASSRRSRPRTGPTRRERSRRP